MGRRSIALFISAFAAALTSPPPSSRTSMASAASSDAAGAAKPVFVLDALRHTDPLPGPVWRDRLFCSYVGDGYMESTELQGMDQKRGGDMGPLLAVLAFLAEQTRNERGAELAAVGVDAQGMRALDKVIQIFKTRSVTARLERWHTARDQIGCWCSRPQSQSTRTSAFTRCSLGVSALCVLDSACLWPRHCKPSTRRISSHRSVRCDESATRLALACDCKLQLRRRRRWRREGNGSAGGSRVLVMLVI